MIGSVGLDNVIQLSEAETKEMVQAFSLKATNPAFDKTIRDGCLVRSSDGAAIGPAEELIESFGELAITVVDQEPYVDSFILGPHTQVSGLLLHPFTRGVAGTW